MKLQDIANQLKAANPSIRDRPLSLRSIDISIDNHGGVEITAYNGHDSQPFPSIQAALDYLTGKPADGEVQDD